MFKKKIFNKTFFAVIAFFACIIFLYLVIEAVPKIKGLSMQTEIVEYADLPVQDTVTGLFVRNETLYSWSSAGVPNYTIDEGTKVRRGQQVFWADAGASPDGKVTSEQEENIAKVAAAAGSDIVPSEGGVAPMTAIVSYFADGYEKKITPENMFELDESILETLPDESVELTRSWINAGEPVYKITDNNLWYFVFWKERTTHKLNEVGGDSSGSEDVVAEVDEQAETEDETATDPLAPAETIETGASVDDYTIGRGVTLELATRNSDDELGSVRVSAVVDAVEERTDGWFVVIRSDMYYKDLVRYRKQAVNVIFEEYSGAVVGKAAIKEQDGKTGVFVKQQSGAWKWTPVNILRTSGDKCLISQGTFYDLEGKLTTTVSYYDEVMSDPAAEGY